MLIASLLLFTFAAKAHAQMFRDMVASPAGPVAAPPKAEAAGTVSLRTMSEKVRGDMAGAQAALARDDFPGALALYDRVLAMEPQNSYALAARAGVLHKLGRFDAARRDLERALGAGADGATIGASLALLAASQDVGSVDDSLTLARRFSPSTSYAAVSGQINALKGDYQAAEELFRRSLRNTPDHPTLLWNYAVVLDHLGKGVEAAKHYKRAQQAMPPPNTPQQVAEHQALQLRLAWLDPSYQMKPEPVLARGAGSQRLAEMPVAAEKTDSCGSLPFGAFGSNDCSGPSRP
ncbi:tetratricopeptide repeat protein [Polaromonas sp.]|uniref:tetratricopeptide repeat protein n=1 Tax=Polaromonas sp. TaxID=1869339 RepID=UPI0035659038